MYDCTVDIVTFSGGIKTSFHSVGTLQEDGNGFSVRYRDQGDGVFLGVRQDSFFMRRTGSGGLCALFRAGEQTAMDLTFEGSEGKIPLMTSAYKLFREEGKYRIRLTYRLIFPREVQKFKLEISIKIISEEQ